MGKRKRDHDEAQGRAGVAAARGAAAASNQWVAGSVPSGEPSSQRTLQGVERPAVKQRARASAQRVIMVSRVEARKEAQGLLLAQQRANSLQCAGERRGRPPGEPQWQHAQHPHVLRRPSTAAASRHLLIARPTPLRTGAQQPRRQPPPALARQPALAPFSLNEAEPGNRRAPQPPAGQGPRQRTA